MADDSLAKRMAQAKKNELQRKGASSDQADKILHTESQRRRDMGRPLVVAGILMLVAGVVATVGSFTVALLNGGGTDVFAGGFVVAGVASILKGRSIAEGAPVE